MKPLSNLTPIAEDEEAAAEDLDDVSVLGMDDLTIADTVTTAFKSVAFKAKQASESAGEKLSSPVKTKKVFGNTAVGLPFVIDMWRDYLGRGRFSVQTQLLSGNEVWKKVFARVSTDQLCLVLTLPMSPYMARSDFAFDTFVLAERPSLSETEMNFLKILLKHHPKCAARMVAVSKVKGRSLVDGFFYEQRIPLPKKARHTPAETSDDDIFFGKKFVEYPDGSIHLHVELVVEAKDGYVPPERMLDPKLMKASKQVSSTSASPAFVTPPKAAVPMEVDGPVRVIPMNLEPIPDAEQGKTKRKRTAAPVVETVDDDDDEEEEDDDDWEDEEEEEEDADYDEADEITIASQSVGGAVFAEAIAAADASATAQAEKASAIRKGALDILDKANNSSLQRAARRGRAAAKKQD